MSYLKLIETGVPKEKLGLLAVPLTPLQLILPFLLSRYTNGPRPFDLYIKSIPYRLMISVFVAFWVYLTPFFKNSSNEYPLYFYILCLLINSVQSIFTYSMFVSQMAFFAKISDKAIGGSYMTFLNTITNMGGNWPSTSALYVANYITKKSCSYENIDSSLNSTVLKELMNNTCANEHETKVKFDNLSFFFAPNFNRFFIIKICEGYGAFCLTNVDAYYVLTAFCTVIGVIWYLGCKKTMNNLQHVPKSAFKIAKSALN